MPSSNSFQAPLTLEQVIDKHLLIVPPNMLVTEAIALMNQQQSSVTLVVEQQQLLGIFTERDVVRVIASTMVLEQVAIAQVMTCQLITLPVTQAQDIFQVLSVLRQHQICHLPIVDDWGQVIGVVTTQKLGEFFVEMSTPVKGLQSVAELTGELSQQQQAQNLLEQQVIQHAKQLTQANQQLEKEIAEHQLLEEKLRTSEATIRAIFGAMIDIVLILDAQGNNLTVAPTQTTICVETNANIIEQTIEQFFDSSQAEMFINPIQRALVLQQMIEFEYSLVQGKREIWFAANISPISDDSVIWVARDITYRKQTEEALQKAHEELEQRIEQRTAELSKTNALLRQEISDRQLAEKELKHTQIFLNSLLENLPVGVFAKDARELRFVFWNEFSTHLMGYSASEAIGKSDYDLFPHEQAEFCTTQDREVLSTGKIVANAEEVVHTAHLGQRIFSVTKAPIFDEVGRTQYVMGIVEDITERKQAEAAKRDAENKTILLQEIHHRVKNNLQIVSGLLYLQSRLVEDERTLQMLQDSRNRLQAMGLIHEKLYSSKNIDSIDFRDYIRSLTQTLFTSYTNNTAAIALTLNIAPIVLDIDIATPCGLIVNELVSNALKYAFLGKKTGEITVEFYEDGDNNFALSVCDDGIGMAEEINYQTQKSLGMRLVHSLVTQQLEGTLELDRSNGTTFRIRFPNQ
jgi:PAS domain S-box-containing protein